MRFLFGLNLAGSDDTPRPTTPRYTPRPTPRPTPIPTPRPTEKPTTPKPTLPPTPKPTTSIHCNGIYDGQCPTELPICICAPVNCGLYPGYEGCRGQCVSPTVLEAGHDVIYACRKISTDSPTTEPTTLLPTTGHPTTINPTLSFAPSVSPVTPAMIAQEKMSGNEWISIVVVIAAIFSCIVIAILACWKMDRNKLQKQNQENVIPLSVINNDATYGPKVKMNQPQTGKYDETSIGV